MANERRRRKEKVAIKLANDEMSCDVAVEEKKRLLGRGGRTNQ